MTNSNREYKSSVFKDLFQTDRDGKKNFLSLYNALHDTNYKIEEVMIEAEEIKQTLYHTYYNDVSMLINGKLIVLMEHQSTINENMPLRFLDYIARLYESLIPDRTRFKRGLVQIPTPEFYIFYNGTESYPDYKELKLSDAFIEPNKKQQLELKVNVYNISEKNRKNSGSENLKIENKCDILKQYCQFVEIIRKDYDTNNYESFTKALSKCIEQGILSDYLKRNSTEVFNLLVNEYRYEDDVAAQREEASEMRAKKDALAFIKEGVNLELIAKCLEFPLQQIQNWAKEIELTK